MSIESLRVEIPSPHERELTITIPTDVVSKEYRQALRKIQQVASRPGFRPGKLPEHMVKNFFGADIKRTLLEKLIEKSFEPACKSEALTPITDPKMEPVGELEANQAFTYKALFQIKPTISVKNYQNLGIEIAKFVFSDQDIEDELNGLRENQATFVSPENRDCVEAHDLVGCDSEVLIEGELNQDYSHKDYSVPLFAENVPEDLRNALVGKKLGEIARVSYTMPSDHQDENIKGKKCEMLLTVKSFKARVLPKLDDDFAKDLSDKFTSLEDLRESVRLRFSITARRRDDYFKQEAITRALVENNDFDVPPAMVERMALSLVNRQLESVPKNIAEDAVKHRWKELWDSVQERAVFRVKAQLIFEALIAEFAITASHDEIHQQMHKTKDASHEDAAYTIQVEKLLALIEKSAKINLVEKPLFAKEHEHESA